MPVRWTNALRALILTTLTFLAVPVSAESIRTSVTVSGLTCPSCLVIAGRSIDALEANGYDATLAESAS